MRSKCRSSFLTLSLIPALCAMAIGADSPLSFFLVAPAQAKGAADNATTGDGEAADGSGAKCSSSGQGAASGAAARGRHHSGGFSREGGLGRMALDLSMLNLSEDQKNKIKTIRGRNAARAKDLRQSLSAKGDEFRTLIFSESATNDQIMAKRDELKPLKDELENLRLSDLLAIRGVLTPEQRKKWAESRPAERKPQARGSAQGNDEPDKADKSASSGSTTSVKVK